MIYIKWCMNITRSSKQWSRYSTRRGKCKKRSKICYSLRHADERVLRDLFPRTVSLPPVILSSSLKTQVTSSMAISIGGRSSANQAVSSQHPRSLSTRWKPPGPPFNSCVHSVACAQSLGRGQSPDAWRQFGCIESQ